VRLAVLVDRGHREVPVRPNYVGKNIPSSDKDRVRVKLRGLDQEERDQVVMYSISPGAGVQTTAARDEKTAVKNS
jgi:pyrimidine operon attenuation protein/uracil phosphoribosyltransferase